MIELNRVEKEITVTVTMSLVDLNCILSYAEHIRDTTNHRFNVTAVRNFVDQLNKVIQQVE